MIFQTNKKQSVIINKQSDSQAGVTLLLAILILSSIMAISFSLAAILFTETKSSADLIRSEPAYYGANGVAEDAIFKVKRKTCSGGCTYTTNFSNNVSMPVPPVQTSTTTPIFQDVIPANSTFDSAKMYDLSNSTTGLGASGYSKITITYIDTGTNDTLNIWLCQFDPTFGVDPTGELPGTYNTKACSYTDTTLHGPNSTSYWLHPNVTLTRSGGSITWTDLDPTKQQKLILFNPGSTNNIVVNIETFIGSDPNYIPTGLPYAGETAVEINTINASVGRKIRVVIPNGSATSETPVDTVFIDDALPAGAIPGSDGGDSWNWVSASPTAFSGTLASQSNTFAWEHQHYFYNTPVTLNVNTGDKMVAYVYMDKNNPPSEIEVQWSTNEQSWNHRAFWNNTGTDLIGWGSQGTQSLQYMGPLPNTDQWVRLVVPASLVGLEGLHVNGVAFTLYGGRATWDHAGKNP